MNKRLFKSLLYREFYVARKFYGLNLLVYVMFVVVGLLALLSYRWGNLHLYSHLMSDMAKTGVDNAIRFTPVFIAACFFGGALDSVPNDEKVGWRRFRTACPAKPFQLSLAKYSCLFLTWLVSFGMALGWLGLHSLLTGVAITRKDITTIFGIYSILAFFFITIVNLIIWLKSSDLAVLIFLGVLFGSVIIIAFIDPDFSKTKAFFVSLLPFAPLMIPVLFLLGLFCTTMLYGRREK